MQAAFDRRSFLSLAASTTAAVLAPRRVFGQAAIPDRIAQGRAMAAQTPITTTKLADNAYLLQGAGGNMVLQTGPDGNLLIDSSFSTSVQKVLAAIGAVSKDAPHLLINTHWHYDHTDGNDGMHAAGFTILAHTKTKERLSTPQVISFFHITVPPDPAGSWPTMTFDDAKQIKHNGDSLDLVHVDPAHTDTDIYIQFPNADVLHLGDTFFNGIYPFIDEASLGNIGGMIKASEKGLSLTGPKTKIVPGHGPLADKTHLQSYRDMLVTVRDRVAKLKTAGASEQEVVAKKPTADFDATWGKGIFNGDVFAGLVYRTI
jgi:glyoxylase-like metal-dependent hydrolase (beta-lactamase superfamily II)